MTNRRAPRQALRVFVVENHVDTRESLCMLLQSFGHTVASAESMGEALEQLPHKNCDVLISDIGLPDGNGWELLRQVRLHRPIYAIAMSGYGMNADRERSLAAGYQHHLVKPTAPEQLEDILDRVEQQRAHP